MSRDFGFPVGTRVILIKEDPCGQVPIGETGEVCDIVDTGVFGYECNIGVVWDRKGGAAYHSCNERCEEGYGRYVPHTCLALHNVDLGEIQTGETDIFSLFI